MPKELWLCVCDELEDPLEVFWLATTSKWLWDVIAPYLMLAHPRITRRVPRWRKTVDTSYRPFVVLVVDVLVSGDIGHELPIACLRAIGIDPGFVPDYYLFRCTSRELVSWFCRPENCRTRRHALRRTAKLQHKVGEDNLQVIYELDKIYFKTGFDFAEGASDYKLFRSHLVDVCERFASRYRDTRF